jgi:hypothetical protein
MFPRMLLSPMHLVQILLPLFDNEGRRFPHEAYRTVREEMVGRFGGLTAFTRAPAEGLWAEDGGTIRDEIVIFEVMADDVDRKWWIAYRQELERRFRQDRIVVRAQEVKLL